MKKRGSLIVISGPSGAGKSTLISRARTGIPGLEFSVSCTTRAPRPGEVNGREYFFISEDEFSRREAAGEFLECAGVFAHRYGTLKSQVMERLLAGHTVVLDIDVQGALSIRKACGLDPELAACASFILIAPPDLETLEKRLRSRASDSEEQILKRLAGARRELAHFRAYDFLIVNDDLDRAVNELLCVLRALASRVSLITEEIYS